MPQITKIRIVNVRYNNGNRFIPDELYDLSPAPGKREDAVFHLNNGGGKTVLIQMMMQPIIPKAKVGKRTIEDFFSFPGDHSYILLEWAMDGCDDRLLTGISICAGTTNNEDDNSRKTIRYYTFMSVYGKYSAYDITKLELSRNENGKYIPANFEFIRNLAKSSKGELVCYSSDDSRKWADALNDYGISCLEWKNVIEEINREEGGLIQYFSDAETPDALIEKFYIPTIDQKLQAAGTNSSDSSLRTMIQNYSKKILEKESEIKEMHTNKRLLEKIERLCGLSETLFNDNEKYLSGIKDIQGFMKALNDRSNTVRDEELKLKTESEEYERHIDTINHEKKSLEYHEAADKYTDASERLKITQCKTEECKSLDSHLRHKLDVLNCSKLYREICDCDIQIDELNKIISEKENNTEDAERIASLKYSLNVRTKEKMEELENNNRELSGQRDGKKKEQAAAEESAEKARTGLKKAEKEYTAAETALSVIKKDDDETVSKLGITILRRLDGFYPKDEIDKEREEKEKLKAYYEDRGYELDQQADSLEDEKDNIKSGMIETEKKLSDNRKSLKEIDKEIAAYRQAYSEVREICENYNYSTDLIFDGQLKGSIENLREESFARIRKYESEKDELEEKLNAARNGYLHILPVVMKYVSSAGIDFQTGEGYLCALFENGSLKEERMLEILEKYPEIAYSIIFNNDKDRERFVASGNSEWLPCAVPLFTMDQMGKILDHEMSPSVFLAAYDPEYFKNRTSYFENISKKIDDLSEQIKRHEIRCTDYKKDISVLDKFTYSASWEESQKIQESLLQAEIELLEIDHAKMEKELNQLSAQLKETRGEIRKCGKEAQKISNWLERFEDLSLKLSEEEKAYELFTECIHNKEDAERTSRKADEKCLFIQNELKTIESELLSLEKEINDTDEIFRQVKDAKESAYIDGEISVLYVQYTTLLQNMSESISKIRADIEAIQKRRNDAKRELSQIKNCDLQEYQTLEFTFEKREGLISEIDANKKEYDSLLILSQTQSAEYGNFKGKLDAAKKNLEKWDGNALDRNEIGSDFENRIKVTKTEIRNIRSKLDEYKKEKDILRDLLADVKAVIRSIPANEKCSDIKLSDNLEQQWKQLENAYSSSENIYNRSKKELKNELDDTINEFRTETYSRIITRLISTKDIIDNDEMKGDRFYTIASFFGEMKDFIIKLNSQIETELKEIENDLNDVVNQCVNQGKRVYQGLLSIVASSRMHIYDGKPLTQMIKMDIPSENEISPEASRLSIKEEIEKGANEIKELMKLGADIKVIRKKADSIVSSKTLLYRYIKQDTIRIRIYKIDFNQKNSCYKDWKEALSSSDGEKSVFLLAVVLTLMNHIRSSVGLVNKKCKSTLILDNPFGKLSSAHLLQPFFNMASHFNVQLICVTDINKGDVVNCFDNVFKLLIKQQKSSNIEILTHEGNENIEHGYYKVTRTQIALPNY